VSAKSVVNVIYISKATDVCQSLRKCSALAIFALTKINRIHSRHWGINRFVKRTMKREA